MWVGHGPGADRRRGPGPALREAVVNAITHRGYHNTANVQVYIFQDRVEIGTAYRNAGGGPGQQERSPQPLLFSMLYRMKLVEQIGSGIRRIHDACREHGVADPAIEVSPDWLTVTFPRSVEAPPMLPP